MNLKVNKSFASPPRNIKHSHVDLSSQIEEMFSNPDFDVPAVKFEDGKLYAKELKALMGNIPLFTEWEEHLDAIQRIMGMIKGGALKFDNFLNLIPSIIPFIKENITNLRSTIVKYCCLLVAQLAMALGQQFESCSEQIIPILFKPTTHGTQIIADSARHGILTVCKYVCTKKIVKLMVQHLSSKSSLHRTICARSFCIMLRFWDPIIIKKVKSIIEAGVGILLSDASPEARAFAREATTLLHKDMVGENETIKKLSDNETSAKRRAASVGRKMIKDISKTLKVDDIKQMIILGDESAIKENSQSVVSIVVGGLTGRDISLVNTCFTLFAETVDVIPDAYLPIYNDLMAILLHYELNQIPKQKRLIDRAFDLAVRSFGLSKVLESIFGHKNVSSYQDLINRLYIGNEDIISNEFKEAHKNYLPINESKFQYVKPKESRTDFSKTAPSIKYAPVRSKPTDENQHTEKTPNFDKPKNYIKESRVEEQNTSSDSKEKNHEASSLSFIPLESEYIEPAFTKDTQNIQVSVITQTDEKILENGIQQSKIEKDEKIINQERINKIEKMSQNREPEGFQSFISFNDNIRKKPFQPGHNIKTDKRHKKEVDLKPKINEEIRQKEKARSFILPDTNKNKQNIKPLTQTQKLISSLGSSDPSSALRKITQYVNRTGSKDYREIIIAILPFMHSSCRDLSLQVVSAIIKNTRCDDLLEFCPHIIRQFPREGVEFLYELSKYCSSEIILNAIQELFPLLGDLSQHELPEIRKAVVFCIVQIWNIAGDSFAQFIDRLPDLTQKLVKYYYTKNK